MTTTARRNCLPCRRERATHALQATASPACLPDVLAADDARIAQLVTLGDVCPVRVSFPADPRGWRGWLFEIAGCAILGFSVAAFLTALYLWRS